jgi:hypothetical protein
MAMTDLTDAQKEFGIKIDFYHMVSKLTVSFKAFLTTYADTWDSKWESHDVYGRMDPIMVFTQTQRKISLGWNVIASTAEEAVTNLEDCALLSSMLYPSYSGGDSPAIQSPPLFRVKFMNLIQSVGGAASLDQEHAYSTALADLADPGIDRKSEAQALKDNLKTLREVRGSGGVAISGLLAALSGLSFTPNFDYGAFIVDGSMYPQEIALSTEITVLHDHQLGWTEDGAPQPKGFTKYPYGASLMRSGMMSEDTVVNTSVTSAPASAVSTNSEPSDTATETFTEAELAKLNPHSTNNPEGIDFG